MVAYKPATKRGDTGMHRLFRALRGWTFLAAGAVALAAIAGQSAAAAPTNAQCEARINGTVKRLLECIRQQPLFDHLVDLQKISDDNPGGNGHGNRDTGKPGYKASVDYVAGLVRKAGYTVTVQTYDWEDFELIGVPTLAAPGHAYAFEKDWYVARLSGQGSVNAPVQPVGPIVSAGGAAPASSGCVPRDFADFRQGNIALIQRGGCSFDDKVRNAQAAGAAAVVLFNSADNGVRDDYRGTPKTGAAFPAHLVEDARIPVIGTASYAVGADLYRHYAAGAAPRLSLDVKARHMRGAKDYNLIADSPLGDPNHVVVVEGHLDAIYGAGILDNGSGSSTILEVALKMARTPTLSRLRYIWFGGEELGLLGSHYYTGNLTQAGAEEDRLRPRCRRHRDAQLRDDDRRSPARRQRPALPQERHSAVAAGKPIFPRIFQIGGHAGHDRRRRQRRHRLQRLRPRRACPIPASSPSRTAARTSARSACSGVFWAITRARSPASTAAASTILAAGATTSTMWPPM